MKKDTSGKETESAFALTTGNAGDMITGLPEGNRRPKDIPFDILISIGVVLDRAASVIRPRITRIKKEARLIAQDSLASPEYQHSVYFGEKEKSSDSLLLQVCRGPALEC